MASSSQLVDGTSSDAPGRLDAHLFLGVWGTPCRWELSRLLNSIRGPSGGQSQAGACRDRVTPGRSGGGVGGLVAGEHVPDGDQDLARDRRLGRVAVAGAGADVEVEPVPGVRFAPRLLGRLDGRPAEQARARLAERAAARPSLTRLADARGESTVGDELLRAGEAADLADLDRDRQGEQFSDAGDRVEQHRAAGRPWRT